MAASVLRNANAHGSTASATTTATWATAPTSGDFLLALVDSDATISTGPTGYTQIGSNVGGQAAYLYEKTAGTSESTSLAVTMSAAVPTEMVGLEVTGATARDALSAVGSTQSTAGQTTFSCPTITTTTDALVIAIVLAHAPAASTGTATMTWGNSFTALGTFGYTSTTASGTEVIAYVATRSVVGPTVVGATTGTLSAGSFGDSSRWTVAYRSGNAAPSPLPPRAVTHVPRIRAAHF